MIFELKEIYIFLITLKLSINFDLKNTHLLLFSYI